MQGVFVIELGCVIACCALSTEAVAQTTGDTVEHIESSERAHMMGLRLEWGRSASYGVFYSHDWVTSSSSGGVGATAYGGVGGAVSLVTDDHTAIDAVVVGPLARGGVAGDAGLPLELDVHPAIALHGGSVSGTVAIGFLAGFRYFGLGYVLGLPLFPFVRPSWMATHRFGVRLAVPVHTYAERETKTIETAQ